MGQPSKEFALPEDRLASEEISEGLIEEFATPCTGRMTQNPAIAPTHHTRSDGNFVKAMNRTGLAFKYLAEKLLRLSEAKIKRGFLWVLRSASLSETICSIPYFSVTRNKLRTRFVWYQQTSSGISGEKTTRN